MKTDTGFEMTIRWRIVCFFRRNWARYITKTLVIKDGKFVSCGHFKPKIRQK